MHQPDLLTLADHDPMRVAEDAGMRDMQIGENTDLARLDHVFPEAREITRAGAAGVDADRGPAPINMRVQINKTWGDDGARHVAHIGSRIDLELVSDHDHLARGEGDIRYGIELLGGVNHAAAAQDQIESHCNLRM